MLFLPYRFSCLTFCFFPSTDRSESSFVFSGSNQIWAKT